MVVYQAAGDIDPMQEENDNNEEESYEVVDIDSFVRINIIDSCLYIWPLITLSLCSFEGS